MGKGVYICSVKDGPRLKRKYAGSLLHNEVYNLQGTRAQTPVCHWKSNCPWFISNNRAHYTSNNLNNLKHSQSTILENNPFFNRVCGIKNEKITDVDEIFVLNHHPLRFVFALTYMQ